MVGSSMWQKSFAVEHENWLEFRGCFSLHTFWKITLGFWRDVKYIYSQGRFFFWKKYALLYFSLPILMVLCDVCPPTFTRVRPRPSACSSLTFYLFSDALLLVSASKLKGVWRRSVELGQRNQDAWPMHHDNSDVDIIINPLDGSLITSCCCYGEPYKYSYSIFT